jgi:hypothetical protein
MKADNILQTIGNTPHIRINRLFGDGPRGVDQVRARQPRRSIKDRIALAMVEDAERRGTLFRRAARSSSRPPATPASAWRWSPRSRATSWCW